MPNTWPLVSLGDVLQQRVEFVRIDDLKTYNRVRVQLHAKGIVLRDTVAGTEIKTKKQQVCLAGEFLVAEIDAKVGGVGIVPDDLAGAIVSSHYFLFELADTVIDRRFLDFFIRTSSFQDQVCAKGSTNYAAIRPADVLGFKIPLPPLDEQRRIVARIEKLAAKIQEVRGLREQSITETEQVLPLQAERKFEALSQWYPKRNFASFEPHVTSGPRNWGPRHAESGFRFYRAQDIGPDSNLVGSSKMFIVPPNETQGANARLMPGDLMMVITGATVGRCAVFPSGTEPGFVNQHVALCRLPVAEVDPYYALWGLRTPTGRGQLLGQRYGQGKPGLNLSNIRAITLPFPPIEDQRRIVAYLDALQAKVDALKKLQAETAAELDALLPSILDRAFRGELRGAVREPPLQSIAADTLKECQAGSTP